MTAFTKHVGRNKNGTRLVVVYREIPGAEDYCLCVETDSLMEMYHDQLLREVNSKEAQDKKCLDLFTVLERRHFGDGQQMLNGLHQMGKLRKYPIADITMMPMPNRPVPLAMVNEQIKTGNIVTEHPEATKADATEAPVTEGVSVDTEAGLVKPVDVAPVTVGENVDSKAAAESKLLQARLMEEDAKKMREEAYSLDPSLKKGGRPSKKQQKKVANAKKAD